jgi:hypothetical protein
MLDFLRPYLLFVVLAACVACGISGWKVRDWQCKAQNAKTQEKAAQETARMQGVIDEKSAAYEAERSRAAVVATERTNTIREIFRDVPTADPKCVPPPELGRVLSQSVLDANRAASTGQSSLPMPAALPPAGAPDGP